MQTSGTRTNAVAIMAVERGWCRWRLTVGKIGLLLLLLLLLLLCVLRL
jgi:hypothetical protein